MTSAPRLHAFGDDALGHDDATGVAARIANGEITATEAVEAAIHRIAQVNPTLNAQAFDDYARARARASRLNRPRAAFGGVPSGLKNNVHIQGMPLTFGSKAMPTSPKTRNGALVEQFLSTGTIPICTTQTPEFGWTATTERLGGDVTRNPWNPQYSPGGSSGGTAALVAAGALPFAHGNDGGGSIRIPAAACGLVGLKPSRGRTGGDPISARMPVDLVSHGVLTRSVRDTARFFHALEEVYPAPKLARIGLAEHPPTRPLRIGLLIDSPSAPNPTDAETRRVVEATARTLTEAGHTVFDYTPSVPDSFRRDFEDYWSLLAFTIATQGRRLFGPEFRTSELDPFTLGLSRRFLRRSPRIPLVVARLAASRLAFEREIRRQMDLLLSPVLCHTTPLIGHLSADQPFEQHFARLIAYVGFTPLHNATGAPAISLPVGLSSDGLPIGVMLSARVGHERTLLEIGFQLEEAMPFPRIDA